MGEINKNKVIRNFLILIIIFLASLILYLQAIQININNFSYPDKEIIISEKLIFKINQNLNFFGESFFYNDINGNPIEISQKYLNSQDICNSSENFKKNSKKLYYIHKNIPYLIISSSMDNWSKTIEYNFEKKIPNYANVVLKKKLNSNESFFKDIPLDFLNVGCREINKSKINIDVIIYQNRKVFSYILNSSINFDEKLVENVKSGELFSGKINFENGIFTDEHKVTSGQYYVLINLYYENFPFVQIHEFLDI